MESGQINSILRRNQGIQDQNIENIDKRNCRSINERAEAIMSKVEEQFEEFEVIRNIAETLLEKYGNSENIPEEELNMDKTGIDEARLLAFCRVMEKQKNQPRTLH